MSITIEVLPNLFQNEILSWSLKELTHSCENELKYKTKPSSSILIAAE